jgi:hypothetical protein
MQGPEGIRDHWHWRITISVKKEVQQRRINLLSSDHFDKICQFLAGIEVYPFAVRIGKSQAPVTFALDPRQIIVSCGSLEASSLSASV